MTFAQHLRTKSSSKPQSCFFEWREGLPGHPAILATTPGGADPGAQAPIVGTSTIRANEIDKTSNFIKGLMRLVWKRFQISS